MNPKAKTAEAIDGFKIEVEFTNGEVRRFDMAPFLKFPLYQPLREHAYFEKAFVSQAECNGRMN